MSDPSNTVARMNKVTLDEVARRAGVSKASASKALNGRKDVSDETRSRVFDAAEALGYRSRTPRAQEASASIAIVADNLSTTYTLDILKGASIAALQLDIALDLSHTSFDGADRPKILPLTDQWVERFAERGGIGVITVTSPSSEELIRRLRRSGLAHLAIDPASPPPAGTASIGATNWNGGVEATQHLIALGHRRIAFVKGPEDSVPGHERFEGYLSALRMNRIPYEPNLVTGDEYSYENGLTAGRSLLSGPKRERPTAIFASNDVTAIGVFEAARELGIRIPEELSVIGFDDTDLARWTTPALTTVHQPLVEMGARAVRTVLLMTKEADGAASAPIQLTTRLVVRNSTAPAPQF
ncbi:LacI family DNA-binding transcriptional regulator [Schaalia hyovaginalis]|uniref:LacI family DNA-binding transcriptional regulator n=1 Tax=Schaalia hyovaginalis TaxID=29316 RepID=UPI0026EBC58C|nr:LacI family DNA-binding transcriptional regulator [Schaalia hyovaginalis]MCI6411818.1 LacI family DNA-binding transcriptional regulator [Schaalia hyovaginalis]MCI7513232.1 LacI family DNA-binding transcriptional regulator [Schaalia hyovaginalis]